jgi:hypothetical protein
MNARILYKVIERKKQILYMILSEINLSGLKKLLKSLTIGVDLKMTETVKNAINGKKCRRASQLNFLSGLVIYLT